MFAGYAGWSPGQLEDEMKRKAWLTHPASLELVFDTAPEQLWQTILRAKAGSISCWRSRRKTCRRISPVSQGAARR